VKKASFSNLQVLRRKKKPNSYWVYLVCFCELWSKKTINVVLLSGMECGGKKAKKERNRERKRLALRFLYH
jgi:hypothetical protein